MFPHTLLTEHRGKAVLTLARRPAPHQLEAIAKTKPIFVDFRVYFCDSGH